MNIKRGNILEKRGERYRVKHVLETCIELDNGEYVSKQLIQTDMKYDRVTVIA